MAQGGGQARRTTARSIRPRSSIPPSGCGSAIAARFPEAGLRRVAAELVSLSRDLATSAKALEQPIWWLRVAHRRGVRRRRGAVHLRRHHPAVRPLLRAATRRESVQGIEASINTLLLAGLGLLALFRAEQGIKRKRVFRELHGLRSLIHVIDMHQLTKDPNVLSAGYKPTAKSPPRITDRFELASYLDYCSEMLSITGKVAALFAQSVNDEVVIEAVNDIEALGSNLSRKIWQKITLIEGAAESADRPARDCASRLALRSSGDRLRRALAAVFRRPDALEDQARQRRRRARLFGKAHDRALEFVGLGAAPAVEILQGRGPRLGVDGDHAPGEQAEQEVRQAQHVWQQRRPQRRRSPPA